MKFWLFAAAVVGIAVAASVVVCQGVEPGPVGVPAAGTRATLELPDWPVYGFGPPRTRVLVTVIRRDVGDYLWVRIEAGRAKGREVRVLAEWVRSEE